MAEAEKMPVPFERNFEKLEPGDGYIALSFGILFSIILFISLKSAMNPIIFWGILGIVAIGIFVTVGLSAWINSLINQIIDKERGMGS